MAAKFTVKGADQILKNLTKLKTALQNKIIKQSIREALKPMRKEVAADAPIGTGEVKEGQKHGTIKRYTKLRAMKRKKGRIGAMIVVQATPRSDTPYWSAFTEKGTEQQKAQHWVEDVFKSNEERKTKEIINNIKKGIERELS